MTGIEIELQPMGRQEVLQAAGLDIDADVQLWTTPADIGPDTSAIELQIYTPGPSPVKFPSIPSIHAQKKVDWSNEW